jgi:hypothetical protein
MLRVSDEIRHTRLQEKEVHTTIRINGTRTHFSYHRHLRPVDRRIQECNGNQVKARKQCTDTNLIQMQVRYIAEQNRKFPGGKKYPLFFKSIVVVYDELIIIQFSDPVLYTFRPIRSKITNALT